MNSIATWFGAIGAVALTAIYPQESVAGGFTGTEFLAWSAEARTSYLQTSMTMATLVIGQTNSDTAACIEQWYLGDPDKTDERLTFLETTISDYPDYHPSAVLLVVLKNECGELK